MRILPQLTPLLKPLTILIGPAPLFYLYRSWQSTPSAAPHQRRPLPPQSLIAIIILLITSVVYIWTLLLGGSENVFYLTQSRFVTPTSVLQSRLAKIRTISDNDQILIDRLSTSLSERINFATIGPTPLIHCAWCQSPHKDAVTNTTISIGDANMYILFYLPQIIAPYIKYAFLLGITTTPFLALSQTCRDLRVYLSYALGLALAAEIWILATFDATVNSSAHDLRDVTWLHWDLHSFRYTCLTMICILHALIIYVIETAWVVVPPSEEERMFQVSVVGENVVQRMRLTRTVREVIMRSVEWRLRGERWWERRRERETDVPEVSATLKRKWQLEAQNWVDAKIKFG